MLHENYFKHFFELVVYYKSINYYLIFMRLFLFQVLFCFMFVSCAIQHNAPSYSNPNRQIPPQTTIAFVDQYGTFYPNDWSKVYGEPPRNGKKNAYSLSKLADEKSLTSDLEKFEDQYLKSLQKHLQNRKRVFVLIHGFNAKAKSVTKNYERIQSKLNITDSDEIIQLYWDGLYTKNPLSSLKTWFSASDYSQFAGKFALRKMLNIMSNKDVYLISHSRGASVVLSALSSAPIDSTKMEDVIANHGIDTLSLKNDLILNKKNRIYAIALGPAIGKSDFEIKKDDSTYNVVFTSQLKSFHVTTNSTDIMLKKVIGWLSNKLNSTDLGYKGDSYEDLKKTYKFLDKTDFSGQKSHDFEEYIKNPKFNDILKKYKLSK